MKVNKTLTALLILSFITFWSCETDDEINEFDTLVETIEGSDGGYINNMGSWIVGYSDYLSNADDYFVLDIRAADDFNDVNNEYDTDHLDGAFNATMSTMFDVIDENNTENKTVLVVCYSGQSASYAHVFLELKGIDAQVLMFGMSGVAEEHDHWTSSCSNDYATSPNWVTTDAPTFGLFDYPELNTGKETGEAILDARIDAAIAAWTKLVAAADVLSDPSQYQIFNYWDATAYSTYGHISGAYQLTPGTLSTDENLAAIDPVDTNVIYCWTGQTSAAVTAYLTVLGYDVLSLMYGANSMIYDELESGKWPGW